MTVSCPQCNQVCKHFKIQEWGRRPIPAMPLTPYVCPHCAAILILDFDRACLYTLEELTKVSGLDVTTILKSKPELWRLIEAAQNHILGNLNMREQAP